jgi:hypothetical protein
LAVYSQLTTNPINLHIHYIIFGMKKMCSFLIECRHGYL